MLQNLSLDQTFYGNTLSAWLTALGVAIVAFAVLRVLMRVTVRSLTRLAERTDTGVDDLVTGLLDRTSGLFVLLVAVWVGSLTLDLEAGTDTVIRTVLVFGFLVQAGFWGMGVINYLVEGYRRRQLDTDPGLATAVGALGFLGRLTLWSIIVLTALANLGVDITAFVASLGIGGLAVALAAQNVLGDLFASLSIVLDKPFVIGDFIIIGDYMGTVEHVGLKTTRLRSLSGEQLVFSNSDLLDSRIRNYKRMSERRALFTVGVTYDTPPEKLRKIPEIVREAVESQENTRFDRCHFKQFGGSSLDFETVYYMLVPDYNAYMDTQQAINLILFERFAEEGLEFAFPSRTVYLEQAGGEPVETSRLE